MIKDTLQNRVVTTIILIILMAIGCIVLFYFMSQHGLECIKNPLTYGVQTLEEGEMDKDVVCRCSSTSLKTSAPGSFEFTVTKDGISIGHQLEQYSSDPVDNRYYLPGLNLSMLK